MSFITNGFFIFVICLLPIVSTAAVNDDISFHRSCSQCGMDRKAYGYSRVLITYVGGATSGTCSIHCAVTEMNLGQEKKVSSVMVADRDSRQLIQADKAFWVIGGKRRGVMSSRPKWAFVGKAGAESFVAANGGALVDWETVLAAARDDAGPPPRR